MNGSKSECDIALICLPCRLTLVSAAAEGRRLHAEVIPLRDVLPPRTVCPWNSSSRPHGATGALGSPNCCRETHAPRPAPAGPSSSLRLPAGSTCPGRRPSMWRDHARGGDRHCVVSPLGSSYCLFVRARALLAIMIRHAPRAQRVPRRVRAAVRNGLL